MIKMGEQELQKVINVHMIVLVHYQKANIKRQDTHLQDGRKTMQDQFLQLKRVLKM